MFMIFNTQLHYLIKHVKTHGQFYCGEKGKYVVRITEFYFV